MSPVFISKKRAVRAFLTEMSIEPSQALSILANAFRFEPESTTATSILVPISTDLLSAA
jgi:hypothetical protein